MSCFVMLGLVISR